MKKILILLLALMICAGAFAACSSTEPEQLETPDTPAEQAMEVVSTAITDGVLSDEYGMRGSQQSDGIPTLSPPLKINSIPEGTAALALTVIDPDGGDWVHWLCCYVPADMNNAELKENASITDAQFLKQGTNDFGTIGYGGPTPPSGVHSYVFTVYALAEVPALQEGFDLKQLNAQLELPDMVLAEASVTGSYEQ